MYMPCITLYTPSSSIWFIGPSYSSQNSNRCSFTAFCTPSCPLIHLSILNAFFAPNFLCNSSSKTKRNRNINNLLWIHLSWARCMVFWKLAAYAADSSLSSPFEQCCSSFLSLRLWWWSLDDNSKRKHHQDGTSCQSSHPILISHRSKNGGRMGHHWSLVALLVGGNQCEHTAEDELCAIKMSNSVRRIGISEAFLRFWVREAAIVWPRKPAISIVRA